ncbi:SDR family oxidoreductase [Polycladomyces sp. WAk]|uniref:SDR family oxidoreductase n=1 Tax=Polycladomyces zharkentensis TaxID=2807616 RepID=A0ABS2WFY8_9BACL|nr:SDR family oxidoreductase [Polycladomyces sp. WAk]MBN2908330.1 SDR family oxidoreductase [Polycladomyces sp. WAk]
MSCNLKGKIAVVTGATRKTGIGAAVCRALAEKGADVFFTHWTPYDRMTFQKTTEREPEELLQELRALGVRAEALAVDLSQPEAAERVLETVCERLGAPSILVNNAAVSINDSFETITAQGLDAHYAVNVRATALLSAGFARRYKGGPGGRIINLTSGQSLGPMPGELSYVATKGAIEALTRTLAAEVAHKGITVNAVNPGPTDTGWMSEELKRSLLPKFPMGRVGQPADAARLIAFLASDEAAWITGQVIHSEGGFIRN